VLSSREVWRSWCAVAIAVAAVAWLYGWSPNSFPRSWAVARPEGFYNELADTFLSGQLYLKRTPDPRLVALVDPYDPAKNEAFRVNDLSYFRGKYYIYMGVAPAVTIFAPFRLLTGRYLTQEAASWLLCVIGLSASCLIVWRFLIDHFASSSWFLFVSTLLVVSLANGFYSVIQGSSAQQVTIAAGFAFAMSSLLCLTHASIGSCRRLLHFAIASATFGCAVASRPNYLFAGLMLVPPLVVVLRSTNFRERLNILISSLTPAAAIIGLVFCYNWARFGRPLEFGQRYQLGGWNQLHLAYSGFGQVWENLRNFLFGDASISPFFPFVIPKTWIATGVLRFVPWLWLSPLSFWAMFRRTISPVSRSIAASALILGGMNFFTLILLPSGNPGAVVTSANSRYLLDFLPALLVFVSLGVIALEPTIKTWSRSVWIAFLTLATALALASGVIGLSLSLSRFPVESFRTLARVMNGPSEAALWWSGALYGPVELNVKFPDSKPGAFEPLLSTGTPNAGDLVFVKYEGKGAIRFGFVSTGFVGPLSPPIEVDFARLHSMEISIGALYPPDGHPLLEHFPAGQVASLRRHVVVQLDGTRVFDAEVPHHDSLPGEVAIGRNLVLVNYSSPQFTGQIIDKGRAAMIPLRGSHADNTLFGPVQILLHFPRRPAAGIREPLLVTGVSQAGDLITVEYSGEGRVRFVLDHWGGADTTSGWLPVDFSIAHVVKISMGSLYPGTDALLSPRISPDRFECLKRVVRIVLDGALAVEVDRPTYESSPFDVVVGYNVIGASSCGYAFTGTIDRVDRLAPQ
jgi:hypothetical protein